MLLNPEDAELARSMKKPPPKDLVARMHAVMGFASASASLPPSTLRVPSPLAHTKRVLSKSALCPIAKHAARSERPLQQSAASSHPTFAVRRQKSFYESKNSSTIAVASNTISPRYISKTKPLLSLGSKPIKTSRTQASSLDTGFPRSGTGTVPAPPPLFNSSNTPASALEDASLPTVSEALPIPPSSPLSSLTSEDDDVEVELPTKVPLPKQSDSSARSDTRAIILTYPFVGHGAIDIGPQDMERLKPRRFLNDNLINLGLKLWYAKSRVKDSVAMDQVHIYSTFFYTRLRAGYEAAKSHTNRVDIFSKKFLIVPIHDEAEQHWYLAVISHPQGLFERPPAKYNTVFAVDSAHRLGWTMLSDSEGSTTSSWVHATQIFIFDSLNRKRRNTGRRLAEYLCEEVKARINITPLFEPHAKQFEVPMQPNQYDCGLYLLHFNYLFMKNPDMFMRPTSTLKKGHASGAEIEWEAGVVPTMREMLKAELLKLSDEWQQLSGR